MASKANLPNGPHSAGIFADMTVDGPEIGTLVLIVDRAKNLPNRKSMGKQNCYCAARLGKEARKTETDQRGGQTPKWDQELRFTVHDSPDYYNMKISVFSEDKRTDLIGEAWLDLNDVVVPGGGKSDLWQGLNCKGKYAGELRVELTYYDTRQKPEKMEVIPVADELREKYGNLVGTKVKRRPLPTNPNVPSTTPVVIPERALPGRARHGPRDLANPQRTASLPPDALSYPYSASALVGHSTAAPQAQPPIAHPTQEPSLPTLQHMPSEPHNGGQYYNEYDQTAEPQSYDDPYRAAPTQPDFLPQLPPSQRQRASLSQQQQQPQYPPQHAQQSQHPSHMRAQSHATLQHAHSAPEVPASRHDGHLNGYDQHDSHYTRNSVPQAGLDYEHDMPRPIARRNSYQPEFQDDSHYSPAEQGGFYQEQHPSGPPPPPMHSHSSPVVPHYASPHAHSQPQTPSRYATAPPSDARYQHPRSTSPLPDAQPDYGYQQTPPSHGHAARGYSYDDYSPAQSHRSYDSSPAPQSSQAPSPYGRPLASRPLPRQSMADPYSTPPRPHPLSQEVPRPHQHSSYHAHEQYDNVPNDRRQYEADARSREAGPPVKPRSASPLPPPPQTSTPTSVPPSASTRPKNTYSIQHPVRAFESSDNSPLSTSQRAPVSRSTPTRKSVSPRPSFEPSPTVPFSPDSYDVHNPNAPLPQGPEPIVGWHGQEIDPSDHLPVDSWAPEPEKKNLPTKTYGLGRDRDFGPRINQTNVGGGARLSKDTVINVRIKDRSSGAAAADASSRLAANTNSSARLTKRAGPPSSQQRSSGAGLDIPSREHQHENFAPVPNPYDQSPPPPSSRYNGRAPSPSGYNMSPASTSPAPPHLPPKIPLQQQQQRPDADQYSHRPTHSPNYQAPYHAHGGSSPGRHSPLPPQPPAQQYGYRQSPSPSHQHHVSFDQRSLTAGNNSQDALSREISSIDLGPSRNRTSMYGAAGSVSPNAMVLAQPPPSQDDQQYHQPQQRTPTYVPVRSHRERNTYY